ncbi:MAG: hypothetical protein M3R30_10540, partial [Candidatus Eremiobacteraeota bacterium]|nr:hypothetical protein [Candidatus Eremiobacteraeota bacterium]
TLRWSLTGRAPAFDRADWPAAESRYVESPETFADRARALLDGETWVRPRIVVRNGVLVEPPPDPRLLRVVGRRSQTFDARSLIGRAGATALDLAGVTLGHPDAIARTNVRVLRLVDVRAGDDLEWLAATPITHLYLHRAYRAASLEPLARMAALRHLDVRGAWQFQLNAMEWKAAFGHLDGLTIDLGSRRKNTEFHRTFASPYPEPFERALRAP